MRDNSDQSEQGAAVQAAPAPEHPADWSREQMPSPKSIKSPAFQFYPKDFLSSRKVDRMSMTERGIYITLLSVCWLEGGLPTDLSELAATCRMKAKQFDRIWKNGKLSDCFALRGDRFINERLEHERKVQSEYRKKQQEKAEKRWNADAVALPRSGARHDTGNAPLSLPRSLSHPQVKKESAEPPCDSTPVFLTFPVVGSDDPSWSLHESRLAGWRDAYPNLDVAAECRKALAWLDANPSKQKTPRGMPAFLVRWFGNASDRASVPASRPGAMSSRTAGNMEALKQFAERKAAS